MSPDENQQLQDSSKNDTISPRENKLNVTTSDKTQEEKTLPSPLIQEEMEDFDAIENDLYVEFMKKKINYWMPNK